MGFLDHSTNNIIVDAVLTDAGRKALARNDGSFQVYQFALGDDEVDYKVITDFGKAVGKEKIEKNTPIMEALTAGSLGLKNKLVSANNEKIAYFPKMTISTTSGDVDSSDIVFKRNSTSDSDKSKVITINVGTINGQELDPQLKDSGFRVEMNHIFLKIPGDNPDIIYTDNIAVYEVNAITNDLSTGVSQEVKLAIKGITDSTFNIYSTSSGSKIRSFVKVTGINSGITKTFEISILAS